MEMSSVERTLSSTIGMRAPRISSLVARADGHRADSLPATGVSKLSVQHLRRRRGENEVNFVIQPKK